MGAGQQQWLLAPEQIFPGRLFVHRIPRRERSKLVCRASMRPNLLCGQVF
jgi:hypothetical protein